jgi:lysosomal acid lipase/cholesteryl ester hydrolase
LNGNGNNIALFRGFPYEEHTIVTHDGFLLTLHRIPQGKVSQSANRPPVLFMHGFMMNSEVWVCLPNEQQCLPFILAEQGYDVWLGNNRGNKYSHKHLQYKPHAENFWDFSMDEIALIDIPTMINVIQDS